MNELQFNHLLVKGHLGPFSCCLFQIKLLQTFMYQFLCEYVFISLGWMSSSEMIQLYGSCGNCKLFPRVAVPFYTPISNVCVIHFVHILARIGYDHCVKKNFFSHSAKYVMRSHSGFNLQFPTDIWYCTPFHVCLCHLYVIFSVSSYLLPIFQLGCLFFTVEFSEFFICSDTSPLWHT